MNLFVHLDSDNVIVSKSRKGELSLEFADRTQESVFLNKREVDELIDILKMHREKLEESE